MRYSRWLPVIALIALPAAPELDGLCQKTEKLLQKEIKALTQDAVVLRSESVKTALPSSPEEDEVLREAWEKYFQMQPEAAEDLLKGREDAEAWKLKALLAYSREDAVAARDALSHLLAMRPDTVLSEKDFPPGIRRVFSELRKERGTWEAVLYYGIERVGWNYQLRGKIVFPEDPSRTREKIIEMVHRKDVSKAVKILVRDLFQIDSHRAIK